MNDKQNSYKKMIKNGILKKQNKNASLQERLNTRVLSKTNIDSIAEEAKKEVGDIKTDLEQQFKEAKFFNSLDETDANELKECILQSVESILDKSYTRIAKSVIKKAEDIINTTVIPNMIDIFSNEYADEMQDNLNEQVDNYLNHVAKTVVNDLNKSGLIVKSKRSLQLEAFEKNLLQLMESQLKIVPEQENIVNVLEKQLSSIKNQLDTSIDERKKIQKKLNESKRELYVLKNTPDSLSESQKEKLYTYVDSLSTNAKNNSEFKEAFDDAVETILESTQVSYTSPIKRDEKIVEDKPQQIKENTDFEKLLSDALDLQNS